MKKMTGLFLLFVLAGILSHPDPAGAKTELRMIIDGETVTAEMEDNPTSRDFMQMLPLTIQMKDFNGTEKIGYPPRKISTQEAPDGFDPSVGDITLYSPWGNLAVFYRDFTWSRGLIRIGRITSGMEKLTAMQGDFTIRFERAQKRND